MDIIKGRTLREWVLALSERAHPSSTYIVSHDFINDKGELRTGHIRVSRDELHDLIRKSPWPDFEPEHLGISSDVKIGDNFRFSMETLSKVEIIHTPGTDGYTRIESPRYAGFHCYIRADEEQQTITYKLGPLEKTYQLVSGTEYVHRPYVRKREIHCVSPDHFYKQLQDQDGIDSSLVVARLALGYPVLDRKRFAQFVSKLRKKQSA